MKSSRQVAVEALCHVEKEKAWSNLALDSALNQAKLSVQDRGFASALFYGSLVRRYTLDKVIESLSNRPIAKTDLAVRNILRTGIYQLLYMDSVPDHAAVSESVGLAKLLKKTSATSFINAVLRGFLRRGKALPTNEKLSQAEVLALEYSCPPNLISFWLKSYGEENTKTILANSVMSPTTFLRVNTAKITSEKLVEVLAGKGIEAKPHERLPNCLVIVKGDALHTTPEYEQGYYHLQDISSQSAAMSLGVKKGERVLDCCAAPGGKTFIIAQQLEGSGEVVACDLHQHRVDEIERRNAKLQLKNITPYTLDMCEYHEELGMFDRVICDAPCSGLGTIRRRPEIKYNELDEFKTLPELQLMLLKNAGKYCKDGGILVYSTCTLSKNENEKVVEKFLEEWGEFHPVVTDASINCGWQSTIMLGEDGGDGFFVATMQRN